MHARLRRSNRLCFSPGRWLSDDALLHLAIRHVKEASGGNSPDLVLQVAIAFEALREARDEGSLIPAVSTEAGRANVSYE